VVTEEAHIPWVPEQRRGEIVRRLLAGDSIDAGMLAELDYELHAFWHVGVIAAGEGAKAFSGRLNADFGRRLLPVSHGRTLWAWLGGSRAPAATDVERLSPIGHADLSVAIGEPGRGIDGWRLTHRQAHAALEVALRKPARFARYEDDRLLAAALQNETLARSLMQKYIAPLDRQREGETLRRTLRVYLDLESNASSAAHTLSVGRRAVKDRVHKVERLIGCHLHECLAELEVALRLDELDRAAAEGSSVR
jgi:PucR C-terminal helix-turn-helix domain/GGDEF-like domain